MDSNDKKYRKMLSTIDEVGNLVKKLLNEKDYTDEYGSGSAKDWETASKEVMSNIKSTADKIKGKLSAYKDFGEEPGFKSSEVTNTQKLFKTEKAGGKFKIKYTVEVKDLTNGHGTTKETISNGSTIEYKIVAYGGNKNDTIKVEKTSGGSNPIYLLHFNKKVVNNQPMTGDIYWCYKDCHSLGTAMGWTGRVTGV